MSTRKFRRDRHSHKLQLEDDLETPFLCITSATRKPFVACFSHLIPPEKRKVGKNQGNCFTCRPDPSRNIHCVGYNPIAVRSVSLADLTRSEEDKGKFLLVQIADVKLLPEHLAAFDKSNPNYHRAKYTEIRTIYDSFQR